MSYKELGLKKALDICLSQIADEHGIQLRAESYDAKFLELIKIIGKKTPVVVLIDEYDKPIIDYLEKSELEQAFENREIFTVKQLEKVKEYEGFYHSIIYIVLKILGIQIDCEIQSNFGTTDAVIKTKDYIYVFHLFFLSKTKNIAIAIFNIKFPHTVPSSFQFFDYYNTTLQILV